MIPDFTDDGYLPPGIHLGGMHWRHVCNDFMLSEPPPKHATCQRLHPTTRPPAARMLSRCPPPVPSL